MALPLSYNWKNLFVRKATTVLTCLVIAAVVGVFTWLGGFWWSLQRSLSFANDRGKIIVLKQGATSETNSAIGQEEYNKLTQLTDLAQDAKGETLKSPEMMVQVSLPRLRDGGTTSANVSVRGVTDTAFEVHRNVTLLGKRFGQGQLEVIVGVQAAKQFAGRNIGDIVNLGYGANRAYKVVGSFSANGAPVESEIWGPATVLLNAYNRSMYSSIALRLRDGASPEAVIKQIEGPAIEMTGKTEAAYWTEQTKNIRTYMIIVLALVSIMAVAAIFAIANTMFSAVAGRTREIAMLRTIGFPGWQIMLSFVLESVFLSLIGGVLGCLACAAYLSLAGNTKDMFGANTFTTMGFEIHMNPLIVAVSLLLVAIVGVGGAGFPAWRASRLQVITALREP